MDRPNMMARPPRIMGGIAALVLVASCLAGCTYSGASRGQEKAYQTSTADPYTSEFQRRTPPGGD